MKTIELRELDVCADCEYQKLNVICGEKKYAGDYIGYIEDMHVECKNYYLCKEISDRTRKIISEQISPPKDEEID